MALAEAVGDVLPYLDPRGGNEKVGVAAGRNLIEIHGPRNQLSEVIDAKRIELTGDTTWLITSNKRYPGLWLDNCPMTGAGLNIKTPQLR